MPRVERYFLSIIAGVMVWVGLSAAFSDKMSVGCSDGWVSRSIGKQGACSHHGGVDYEDPTPTWKKIAFFGVGLGVALLPGLIDILERRRARSCGPVPAFYGLEDETSRLLQDALNRKNPVRFVYRRADGKVMRRYVMPKSLIYFRRMSMENRCLVGYCYLRNEERKFMLSRMSSLELLDTDEIVRNWKSKQAGLSPPDTRS